MAKEKKSKLKSVEKDVVLEATPLEVETTEIVTRISDKGEINLNHLSKQELEESAKFCQTLDMHDVTSIISYGSELQKAMNDNSKSLLSASTQSKLGDETQAVIDDMLEQVSQIDIDNIKTPNKIVKIIRKTPIVNKWFFSVKKFLQKYKNIEEKVGLCQKKLDSIQLLALRDNTRLQKDFDDTVQYIKVLEKLIVAAKIKSNETEQEIALMKSEPQKYDTIEIHDAENFKHELDKKIANMVVWRLTFTQSLFRIRDIQRANIAHTNEIQETINSMMPMLRQQLAQAMALYNLEQGIKADKAFKEGFNKILTQNADAAHDLSIEVAKQTEETSITMETLLHNQERLESTMRETKQIWLEYEKKRNEQEAQVNAMQKRLETTYLSGTTEKLSAETIEKKYLG